MSATAATVAGIIAVLVPLGGVALLRVSARLRAEIDDLLGTFDRAQRAVTPLVVTVRTDRDRLAERLEHLTDLGTETDPNRR